MNSEQVNKAIDELIVKKVAKKLLKFFLDSYSNEGYWKNGKFVGWKDRKRDTGKPLLYSTGHMKQNFEIKYKSDTEFDLINNTSYASYHNLGTGKMPARPMLYDDKKVEEVIAKETDKALLDSEKQLEEILKKYLIGK